TREDGVQFRDTSRGISRGPYYVLTSGERFMHIHWDIPQHDWTNDFQPTETSLTDFTYTVRAALRGMCTGRAGAATEPRFRGAGSVLMTGASREYERGKAQEQMAPRSDRRGSRRYWCPASVG